MKIEILSTYGTWRDIANAARTTIGKDAGTGEPNSTWKTKMLKCEHSPIRLMFIRWKWIDLPYWVSVHFVRHHEGIEHFVSTQRTDRTGVPRNELPQGALVDHECCANLQAILNISKKRMCMQASKETRQAWNLLLDNIKLNHSELFLLCMPECQRYGVCSEYKPCGWLNNTIK